jgi:hypothetical protein
VVDRPRGVVQRRRTVKQAFIVSPARSGSTLLRVLLDTHPQIVSPPELNLSALLQHTTTSWNSTMVALGEKPPGEAQGPDTLTDEVVRRARKPVDEIMVACANATGASLYCDKSLTTVDHLAVVTRCYPRAPLIFLYRYPLDFIASGLEASRWGFNAFGFVPYVSANPGNFIGALANYWIEKVSRMLEFERDFEGANARIYYELLCDQPRDTLDRLFEFLEVDPDDSILERAFHSEHGRGPGDYKIEYTGSISLESVGRGATLPEHLSPQQTERIDQLLGELDYPELAAARRGQLGALLGLVNAKDAQAEGREIAESMARALTAQGDRKLPKTRHDALPFELVVARAARGEPGRVLIDEQANATVIDVSANGDDPKRPRVRCIGDILLRVAAGEVTFGKAVHDGEIRLEADSLEPDGVAGYEVLATLAALIRSSG